MRIIELLATSIGQLIAQSVTGMGDEAIARILQLLGGVASVAAVFVGLMAYLAGKYLKMVGALLAGGLLVATALGVIKPWNWVSNEVQDIEQNSMQVVDVDGG